MATQKEISSHLDLSERRIRDLIKMGVIPQGASLDSARLAYVRHLRDMAAARRGDGPLDLTQERARLAAAQADAAEARNQTESGQLLRASEVAEAVGAAFKVLAQGLAGIPDRLEQRLGLDPALVTDLHREIDAAREALYQDLIKHLDAGQS